MQIERLHGWDIGYREAKELQQRLAAQVSCQGTFTAPRFVAGVDIAVGKYGAESAAAVVILSYPALELVEVKTAKGKLNFPYIPGLLSFREAPLVLTAFEKIATTPGLVFVDGQGVAHPRRMGIACHLGLFLNIPTIGCAKSRLCGQHAEPGMPSGSQTPLVDDGEIIGTVLRTRDRGRPLYISVGHKISLENAVFWTLRCCNGYRLPEPARLAHLAAGGDLDRDKNRPQDVNLALRGKNAGIGR